MCPTLMKHLTIIPAFACIGSYTNGMGCVLDVVWIGIIDSWIIRMGAQFRDRSRSCTGALTALGRSTERRTTTIYL